MNLNNQILRGYLLIIIIQIMRIILNKWSNFHMWQKLLVAIFLGAVVGVVFREKTTYIYPIGQIFVNLIKMLIVPLIFASITTSIT